MTMPIKLVDESAKNSIPDMVELQCEARIDDQIVLMADLRMNSIDVPFSESVFRVGLSGAYLRIAMEGLKPTIGQRMGDVNPLKSNITSESSALKKFNASTVVSALLKGGVDAKTEMGGSVESLSQSGFSGSYSHPGIRALPNSCWRIENPRTENEAIQSSVLAGDTLISLKRIETGNRMLAEISLDAAPSEIVVTSKTRKRRIRQENRERVIQIIATRSLLGRTGARLEPGVRVQLSSSKFEFGKIDDD
jgi:hypothetical protein